MRADILRSEPHALASLMGLEEAREKQWNAGELSTILRHQMGAPLLFDLRTLDALTSETGDQSISESKRPLSNFKDLLHHPTPPMELLRLTKDFAKGSDHRLDNPLPPEIATVLYYAVIVVALMRHGAKISALTNRELRSGIAWVRRQNWLDDSTRKLFDEAKATLMLEDKTSGVFG